MNSLPVISLVSRQQLDQIVELAPQYMQVILSLSVEKLGLAKLVPQVREPIFQQGLVASIWSKIYS